MITTISKMQKPIFLNFEHTTFSLRGEDIYSFILFLFKKIIKIRYKILQANIMVKVFQNYGNSFSTNWQYYQNILKLTSLLLVVQLHSSYMIFLRCFRNCRVFHVVHPLQFFQSALQFCRIISQYNEVTLNISACVSILLRPILFHVKPKWFIHANLSRQSMQE